MEVEIHSAFYDISALHQPAPNSSSREEIMTGCKPCTGTAVQAPSVHRSLCLNVCYSLTGYCTVGAPFVNHEVVKCTGGCDVAIFCLCRTEFK